MSNHLARLRLTGVLLMSWLLVACSQVPSVAPVDTPVPAADITLSDAVEEPFIGYTPEAFLYVGSPQAPVTVYEMFNANCPGCAHHHRDTLTQLVDLYAVPGQVQFVFVDMALSSDWGEDAHFAAYCIGQQQGAVAEWQFWLDFYGDHSRWFREGIPFTTSLAEAADLDMPQYQSCLDTVAREGVYARQQIAESELLPSRWATPVFRLENRRGELLRMQTGPLPLEGWQQELDRHLG